MNYLASGLFMILILLQIYQYQETMKQGYRAMYTQIQKYVKLLAVFFLCSTFVSTRWYHMILILMIMTSCLLYRKDAGFWEDNTLLMLTYISAFCIWMVFSTYMGARSFWGTPVFYDDVFIAGCAYVLQFILMYRRNQTYDQMYIYPAMIGLICFLFLLAMVAHDRLPISSGLDMIIMMLLMMLGSFYRICYCMEVGKEKQILAQEKAYTMMGNKERYEAIQKENDFIMKNMHDLKKHLALLDHLGDRDEGVEAYRKEIQKKTQELLQYQKTGDLLIDKILQLYHPKFMEANIQCNIESEDIDYGFMDAVDLCAVLCNLLDNAYESCLQCEDRFILLKMKMVSDKVIWKMKNSTRDTILHENSSKQDGVGHGYGLQNMKHTAEKYHGELISNIDSEHGIYITAISFKMTEYVENETTFA